VYIISAIIAFSILIVVHELGHFTLAKLNDVKVEEFSLGMGPKLFGIKGKETEYLIKAFPIGGYVKMLGEEGGVSDKRAFSSKTSAQKLSIIAAGPLMNLILAILLFGIVGSMGYLVPTVSQVAPSSPAVTAEIKVGDKILTVNNKKISTWEDFSTQVYAANGKSLNLTLLRDGSEKNINVTPIKDEEQKRFIIGIYPTKLENPTIVQSVSYGFRQTASIAKQTVGFFGTLFKGKASSSDFGGPVTIIKLSGAVAKAGIIPLMTFAAFLSVQLAIFNIIPFPALDGGWIFLFLFEIITRKKIDDKKVGFINYIGFALLMTLMVLVTIKDILYPIKF
jgi:regulator of sigma E protease